MLTMLKSQNPDKVYPSNTGQKWTDEEETLLLEELNQNMDIKLISQNHNRTTCGILARRKLIAYKLYNNNITIEEISYKTKLDEDQIREIIQKKQFYLKIEPEITRNTNAIINRNDIIEMKNEIKELKHTITELVAMMKAVYEFEDT